MPLPKQLARFNRVVTNRVVRQIAGWAPGLAIVVHTGRRSGKVYRTPVNAFRNDQGYRFALTYGRNTDWVKNVLESGTFTIETHGGKVTLTDPFVERDASSSWAPLGVRQVLNGIDAEYYLQCRATD